MPHRPKKCVKPYTPHGNHIQTTQKCLNANYWATKKGDNWTRSLIFFLKWHVSAQWVYLSSRLRVALWFRFFLILSLSAARIMQYCRFVVTSNSHNINYVLPTGVYLPVNNIYFFVWGTALSLPLCACAHWERVGTDFPPIFFISLIRSRSNKNYWNHAE